MAQYILSVGVDIGVVTSGISYCLVGPDEPAVAPSLVPLGSHRAELQATVLAGGCSGGIAWGDEVKPDDPTRLALLKLALLHPDAIRSANPEYPGRIAAVRSDVDRIGAAGKTAPEAVAQYIGCLLPDLVGQISDAVAARGLQPADVSLRFVFGIPAVWGNDAVARMREAIEASGILMLAGCPAPMDLIAEPEAAAIALAGNTVIICDCGGGTVDVITYEIVSISPLRLEECVPGNGKLLGDMFMRSALADLIKTRVAALGRAGSVDKLWLDGEIERAWNTVRESLPLLPSWAHPVHVKYLDGQPPSTVILPSADVIETFRPLTDGVLGLVKSQIDQVEQAKGCAPNLLVIAGGFGCNTFLQSEIRRRFRTSTMGIAITGICGQMAVKEGAAIAGVNGNFHALASEPFQILRPPPHINAATTVKVRNRVARFSCGFWDGNGPRNQITWFITKGSKVPVDITAAIFDLPRAGFTGPDNALELLIYRTPERMAAISAIDGARDVGILCRVRCTSLDLLRRAASLRLGILLKSHTVELQLFPVGSEDVRASFSLG